jgi:hypothetical protein
MEMRKPDSFPSSPRSVIRLESTSVSAGSVLPMSGPIAANISYSGSSTVSPRYGPSVMVTIGGATQASRLRGAPPFPDILAGHNLGLVKVVR